jgi:hypothetical protein
MNKILSIKEIMNYEIKKGYSFDGYEIITEQERYLILISNMQNCCEDWGYTTTNDDVNDFIGSELIAITFTDTSLNTLNIKKISDYGYMHDIVGIKFVNFITSNGMLQLAVYNAHNGFYGHDIKVIKNNVELLDDCL